MEGNEAKTFVFDGRLFVFSCRLEEWALFFHTYPRVDRMTPWRCPDWLAVHSKTDEIRRFVEVARFDVEDDLTGYQPAPFQADLEERWGNPVSQLPPPPKSLYERSEEYWKQHEAGTLPVLRYIERMVQEALMPVYGVAGNVLGVQVVSTRSGGHGTGHSSVGFTFRSLLPVKSDCTLELDTRDLPAYRRDNWHASLLNFKWYPQGADVPLAEHIKRDFEISGATLRGEILYWKQANRSQFMLRGKETLLRGDSRNISLEELFQLLESLVIINQENGLVAQYQHELDEVGRRLFGEGWGEVEFRFE
ncbi:MAG TPA: hypothetical protein VH540_26860 [Ktedonobacterales bacterium]|jgi:hypothetical protein